MPSPPGPDPGDTLVPRSDATAFASRRYTVRRVLGEGSQKVVYLVHDEALDRDCALSMIKSELLNVDDLLRLQREAQAMAHLGAHSNIVSVFDFGQEDGKPYLVCEYVPAGELRAELRNAGGPLALERGLTIAADIARALAVAHGRGVIHRDVKPANVWLCDDGSVKLGDFGLAFSLDHSRLTMPGTVMGTATYMAPEQARGEPVDARSDLYALGCLLYEMVCGRPPFVDDNATAVIAQHINARPSAPSQHRLEVPPALDALILRLLAKAPEDRPQSAAAVSGELQRIADSLERPASDLTRFEPPQRPRKNPTRRLLVAGASVAVVAAVAVAATLAFALRDSGGAAGTTGASLPLVAEGYVPVLEPRVCPPELTSDPAVICHDLVVPETRTDPTGRQIRVLVMRATSKADRPGAPTVFIGGPVGTLNPNLFPGIVSQPAGLDVRDYGDVVAVSIRGRSYSQPMLTCPEVSAVWRDLLALPPHGPEANKLWLDGAERCGRRLVSEGVDLDAYGQDEIAKDVRDLTIAMSWPQINLQGSLDLSRVAVLLAARYPGIVRSVVLADPVPVDAAWYDDRLSRASGALQAYYAACRAGPACTKAFPNLEQALPAGYAKDQRESPVVMVPDPAGGPDIAVLFDGDRLVDMVRRGLSFPFFLPSFAGLLGAPLGSPQEVSAVRAAAGYAVVTFAPGANGDPWGADFSAYCEDVDQHLLRGSLASAEALYPLFRVLAHDPLFELCPRWPTQERSRAIGSLETVSAIPALILTGELDPLAGPAYAERAATAFTHATVAVFPSLTAFPLLPGAPPCISALRLAFLRDPTTELDVDACIAKVPPIAFGGT